MSEEATITDAQLLTWLRAAFPREEPVLLIREPLKSFQQHLEKVTLYLSPHFRTSPDTRTVYLRWYRGYFSWWTLNTPDLPQRECAAWRVAGRANLPLPPLLYASYEADLDVALHAAAPGTPAWEHLNPEVIDHLAVLLARLHSVTIHEEERVHLPDISLPVLFRRFRSWSRGDGELLQKIDHLEESFGGTVARPGRLVHGDCHMGNLLSNGKRITAVLDWEEAAVGDPHIDLAVIVSLLRSRNVKELEVRFLQRYREESGFEVGRMEPWLMLGDLRNLLFSAWMKARLESDLPLPRTRTESWIGE